MPATTSLSTRFDEAQREFEQRIESARKSAGAELVGLEQRYEKFESLRRDLSESVVKPIVNEFVSRFPDTKIEQARDIDGGRFVLTIPRTPERSALMEITFTASHDGPFKNVFVDYELRILPVFIQFERSARFEAPLDSLDPNKLRDWIVERLVAFNKTYLDMQFVEQYQRGSLTTDPVLNRRFPKKLAIGSAKHGQAEYFFATPESKALFEKDPAKYLNRL